MKINKAKPTIKSTLIGFISGFIVLLLLNKFWVKSEHYILHSLGTAFFVVGIITLVNWFSGKNSKAE